MSLRSCIVLMLIVISFIDLSSMQLANSNIVHAATMQQSYVYLPGFPRTEPSGVAFSSPAVIDLNGNSKLDIVFGDGGGCVWAFDSTGAKLAGFPWTTTSSTCSGSARINGPLAIADIDRNGSLEVIAGTRGAGTAAGQRGKTYVWRNNGTLMPGWPKEMDWANGNGGAEVYGITLANVVGDANLEVIAGTSNNVISTTFVQPKNLYVWTVNGTLQAGWPTGGMRNAGVYGNIGAADLTGDGYAEVIAGRDEVYVHVHGPNGVQLPGWPHRTYVDQLKTNYNTDRYVEFTEYIPAISDLDGDGVREIIIAGKLRDPLQAHASISCGIFVFEPDGSRRTGWEIPKQCSGPPKTSEFRPHQGPALADLDGNGTIEIVITLLDGTTRAYRHDGTLLWTYDFDQGKQLYGSDPVIGDITGDGQLEIVFGTYSPDATANSSAGIVALNASGQLLPGFPLPLTQEGSSTKQGIRAAPTLADLNKDGKVDIVAASWAGTLYAWSTSGALRTDRMPWPTGRQNLQRTGELASARAPIMPSLTPGSSALPFLEQSGRVVMEAEDFAFRTTRSGKTWALRYPSTSYVGVGVMVAEPDGTTSFDTNYATTSPDLQYRVQFATTGTYYVWVRVFAKDESSNSLHVGLNGQAIATADRITTKTFGSWVWERATLDGPVATVGVGSAGVQTVNVWMQEDGLQLDRLLLTTSASYVPSTKGPDVSPRSSVMPTVTPQTATATSTPQTSGSGPFLVQNGQVVMEAENYALRTSRNGDSWNTRTTPAGYMGTGLMVAEPDNSSLINTGFAASSPDLQYRVQFATSGTYYVWVRIFAKDDSNNSLHVGLNNQEVSTADRISTTSYGSWVWVRSTLDNSVATINLANTGVQTVTVWMREDGLQLDRLLLTTSSSYTPSGNGPAESPRATTSLVTSASVERIAAPDAGTPLPTATDLPTATATNTATEIATPLPTATDLPTATATNTATETATPLPTATDLPTATATSTETATQTPLPTATDLPTATP